MALVFKTPKTAINTTTRDMQNLSADCPPCPECPECPEVELTTAEVEYTENGSFTVTPESGFDGLSQVDITVNIPSDVKNQDKFVTPTTSSQTITADSGYSGLGTVSVSAVTSSIDANIAAGNIKSGVTILGVTGTVTEGITPTGNINITNTNSTDVTNYATAQVVDANLTAGNIKSGTTILGVQGSYDPQPDLETKTVTYTTNDTYTITPTAGKDGMSSVEVTVNVTGSNCPDWSSIGWDCSDVTASGLAADLAFVASTSVAGTKFFERKITENIASYNHSNNEMAHYVRYVPTQDMSYLTSNSLANSFKDCTIVDNINLINTDHITDMNLMFSGCHSLVNVTLDNTSNVTNMSSMFAQCVALTNAPVMDTSNVTSMSSMFSAGALRGSVGLYSYNRMHLATIPQYNTSNVTNVNSMFAALYVDNDFLTTIPELNFVKVDNISSMFNKCTGLTTLGGFTNLGKAFVGSNATAHTLNLSSSTVLTKESIMNVINNLAAPDDTAVTDATLKLSATSYALLTAEDIAIATAKNWTVTS